MLSMPLRNRILSFLASAAVIALHGLALPAMAAPSTYIDQKGVPWEMWRPLSSGSLRINLRRFDTKKLDPKTLHYWTAQIYANEHSYEEANAEFALAGPVENFSNWALQQYAESVVGEEEFGKALPLIEYLIKRDPKNEMAYYLRGDLNFAGGKQAQAAADYIKSASLSTSRRNRCQLRAGESLMAIRKYEEAVKVLSQAISDPHDGPMPLLYLSRANCYQGLGKWAQAAADFTSAIAAAKGEVKRRRDSEDAIVSKALQERAKCYDHLGKRDLAFKDRESHKSMSRNIESDFFGK